MKTKANDGDGFKERRRGEKEKENKHRMLKSLMLRCKFILSFIFTYFKSCNFNYSDLLLLINNSVGISHCNHHMQLHLQQKIILWKWLKNHRERVNWEWMWYLIEWRQLHSFLPQLGQICWSVVYLFHLKVIKKNFSDRPAGCTQKNRPGWWQTNIFLSLGLIYNFHWVSCVPP